MFILREWLQTPLLLFGNRILFIFSLIFQSQSFLKSGGEQVQLVSAGRPSSGKAHPPDLWFLDLHHWGLSVRSVSWIHAMFVYASLKGSYTMGPLKKSRWTQRPYKRKFMIILRIVAEVWGSCGIGGLSRYELHVFTEEVKGTRVMWNTCMLKVGVRYKTQCNS